MSTTFLLGAGFSKAVCEQIPLLNELADRLKDRIGDLPPHVTALGDDVEHWLTYLSQPQPWDSAPQNLRNKALFLELASAIGAIIRQQEGLKGSDCPEWLMALVSWWHENQSTVITLNYDTLIERVATMVTIDQNKTLSATDVYPIVLPDVMRANIAWGPQGVSTFTLCKLHGSVNWFYSGADSYYGETIYGASVTAWNGKRPEPEIRSLQVAGDKVPLIAPPTAEKVGYFQHETLRRVWSTAGEGLKTATRLVCIGYSLPVTDLSMQFFLRSCRQNGSIPLTVVNKSENAEAGYRRILEDSYTYESAYSGTNAVRDFVEALVT